MIVRVLKAAFWFFMALLSSKGLVLLFRLKNGFAPDTAIGLAACVIVSLMCWAKFWDVALGPCIPRWLKPDGQ